MMKLRSMACLWMLLLMIPQACATPRAPQNADEAEEFFRRQRERMVSEQLKARDIRDRRVLEAMGTVPRHEFVPAALRDSAYQDHPLPIGSGQTISQPYIVALMTQTAKPQPGDRALEIGTGSGYQAAVLCGLVQKVFTIEIIPELADTAARRMESLGYANVHVRTGDGYEGWPSEAPFDVILVTAAANEVPQPLIDQLAEGGRLVMPVGRTEGIQELTLLERKDGKIRRSSILSVRFVPMTGRAQEP